MHEVANTTNYKVQMIRLTNRFVSDWTQRQLMFSVLWSVIWAEKRSTLHGFVWCVCRVVDSTNLKRCNDRNHIKNNIKTRFNFVLTRTLPMLRKSVRVFLMQRSRCDCRVAMAKPFPVIGKPDLSLQGMFALVLLRRECRQCPVTNDCLAATLYEF